MSNLNLTRDLFLPATPGCTRDTFVRERLTVCACACAVAIGCFETGCNRGICLPNGRLNANHMKNMSIWADTSVFPYMDMCCTGACTCNSCSSEQSSDVSMPTQTLELKVAASRESNDRVIETQRTDRQTHNIRETWSRRSQR
jgi:hypothetical protein